MRFSISSRQPEDYLNKADEMFVHWKDRELIYDLYHMAPKTIILRIPMNTELFREDWEKIIEYHDALGRKFKLSLLYPRFGLTAKQLEIPYFFETPANDFPTLNLWKNHFGVSEIIPGATLSHYMDAVAAKGLPIRMIVNRHMMPRWDKEEIKVDGTVGAWVRPEDLWKIYQTWVNFVQFDTPYEPDRDSLVREQALFRIYAEQKTWPGELNMLVDDLNHKGINRLIVENFGERRSNCRQMCEVNGNCHFCYRALDLASPDLLKKVVPQQN